jgi:hypothetical protein
MFRKIMIATIASLALLAPLAMPAQTEAREVHRGHHAHGTYRAGHRYAYRVYYRNCGTGPWRFDASYGCRPDALREAQVMRARGFETVIR